MFGVDCRSGTTFTDGRVQQSMTSMFVPDPVVSLAIIPKDRNSNSFSKALGRFTKEDPTFRVHVDGDKVILDGCVDVWSERKLAERAAWSAPGVRAVEDRLTLA